MNLTEWNDLWRESFASHLEDDNDKPLMHVEVSYGEKVKQGPGFIIYRYEPHKQLDFSSMIGEPEIEQMEEERKRQYRDQYIKKMRHAIKGESPIKDDYDPGYPYETIGELVQAMMREAAGDVVKLQQAQKWADDLRRFLAGNLWGYNARRAAEEARRAAQETKPEPKPEPERKPVKGEGNLLTVAGISKTGGTGKWSR